MDSDRINKIVSLTANLAVVAGIIFLGLELRQNNVLLQQQAEDVYFQNRVVLSEALMLNGDLAEIYTRASKDEELSDVEALRIDRYYRRLFRGFEWEYDQRRSGLITIIRFDEWSRFVGQNKYARETWDWFVQNAASEEFARFVEDEGL